MRNSRPTAVGGALDTVMAGLACGEISVLAWELLADTADAVVSVADADAVALMRRLARGEGRDPPVVAGESAVAGLAGTIRAFEAPPLVLSPLAGFLALVPAKPSPDLQALAARCVETLDGFRAAPEPAELARRREGGPTARQEALLRRWGYPYVMEESRFHLTLTGSFDAGVLQKVAAALAPMLEADLRAPLVVDAVCLFGEDDTGWFHLLNRFPLTG